MRKVNHARWAAQYNTWLLIKLMPKGVVFSFPFHSFPFLSFPFLSFPFLSFPFLSFPFQSNPPPQPAGKADIGSIALPAGATTECQDLLGAGSR